MCSSKRDFITESVKLHHNRSHFTYQDNQAYLSYKEDELGVKYLSRCFKLLEMDTEDFYYLQYMFFSYFNSWRIRYYKKIKQNLNLKILNYQSEAKIEEYAKYKKIQYYLLMILS